MGGSSVSDYLKQNYLSEPKRKKSKKSKAQATSDGVIEIKGVGATIVDDDAVLDSGGNAAVGRGGNGDRSADVDLYNLPPEEVDLAKGWKRLGNRPSTSEPSAMSIAVGEMSSGARAGLQTAAQVARDVERKRLHELEQLQRVNASEQNLQTVYRDATGQKVDLESQLKAEADQKAEQARQQEIKNRQLNLGLVQEQQARDERQKLREMKHTTIARYEDDEELNAHLKSQSREEDPAAIFTKSKGRARSPARKTRTYQGSFAPNRFGIRPGRLWDGVDRSNGFERRWFSKQNELGEKKALRYTMATDD